MKVKWISAKCLSNETNKQKKWIWWRHQMETFSALLDLCAGYSPVTGEFPAQRPVTRIFDVFFDLFLNKRLSKQSWGWWSETLSRSLWLHCNIKKMHFKNVLCPMTALMSRPQCALISNTFSYITRNLRPDSRNIAVIRLLRRIAKLHGPQAIPVISVIKSLCTLYICRCIHPVRCKKTFCLSPAHKLL